MSHWYILGKHPRGQKYRRYCNWQQVESIGLNDAAYIYGTKWAMTGHDESLQILYNKGFTSNVVVINPPFDSCFELKYDSPFIRYAGICDKQNHPYELVRQMVADAIAKADRPYHDFWTILHPCICYVLKEGATQITLIGCNLTKGHLPKMEEGIRHDYALHHTELMVRACRELGIKVNWLK